MSNTKKKVLDYYALINQLSEQLWADATCIDSALRPAITHYDHTVSSISYSKALEIWERDCQDALYHPANDPASNDADFFSAE